MGPAITPQRVTLLAWVIAALILLLFVVAPLYGIYVDAPPADPQRPVRTTIADLLLVAGGMSSVSSVFIAFRLGAKLKQGTSPAVALGALFKGVAYMLAHWTLFFMMSSAGGDGDGILRGWLVILFPFVHSGLVLYLARQDGLRP